MAWDLWIPQGLDRDIVEYCAYDLDSWIGGYEAAYSPCGAKELFC